VTSYDGERSQGSGFFIAGGLFVTNYHVLDGAFSAEIEFSDGRRLKVEEVMAFNEDHDLILCSVAVAGEEIAGLKVTGELPEVGETAIVIGSPKGLAGSLTRGIVSAIRQDFSTYGDVIQIDADISPGSSGGPVVNVKGDVAGVVTCALREGENLNFAIPGGNLLSLIATVSDQGKPLATWAVPKGEAYSVERRGEEITTTDRMSMRDGVRHWVTVSARGLDSTQVAVISGVFDVEATSLSHFRWGPSVAPSWHPHSGGEWYTIWMEDLRETIWLDSSARVLTKKSVKRNSEARDSRRGDV
jgi:S1-C subfamily serine protease